MSRKRGGHWRLLLSLGVAGLIVAGLAFAVLRSGYSLIIVENRSAAPLTLSVETTAASPLSWTGELAARGRVVRTGRLPDSSLLVVCRDEDGIHRTRGGFIVGGATYRIEIVAAGCDAVQIDARKLP